MKPREQPVAPVIQAVRENKGRSARLRLLARLWPQARNRIPFATGFLLAPVFIFLHEAAHFGAARALGFKATLQSGVTTIHYSHLPPPRADLVVTAAGPLLQVLIGGAGLLWLYRLRQTRRTEPATWRDWVATWCALNAGRWIGSPFRPDAVPTPDEVVLLRASGLPVALGLVLLAGVAASAVVATVRLHSPGSRLLPFAYGFVGGSAGMELWLHGLGPRLLP